MTTAAPAPAAPAARFGLFAALALLVALAAVGGSLYLSLGMDLKACPLCLYQRAFVMAAAGILLLAWLAGSPQPGLASLLALPPALAAAGVAAFHVYLEQTGKLVCPQGVLGVGTAPQQALAVQALLLLLLVVDVGRHCCWQAAVAGLLGVAFAVGAVVSAPPMPKPEPFDKPPDRCRPPYPGPASTAP